MYITHSSCSGSNISYLRAAGSGASRTHNQTNNKKHAESITERKRHSQTELGHACDSSDLMLSRGMCAIPFSFRWLLLIIWMPRFLRRFFASLAPASPRLMFPFAALAELSSMRCLSLSLLL